MTVDNPCAGALQTGVNELLGMSPALRVILTAVTPFCAHAEHRLAEPFDTLTECIPSIFTESLLYGMCIYYVWFENAKNVIKVSNTSCSPFLLLLYCHIALF